MKINVEHQEGHVTVTIEGIIKSIVDSQNLQDAINALSADDTVVIDILDSFSLTSTVIGFLLKKINQDRYQLTLRVHNSRLWDLLDHLNLTEVMNVQKAA